MTVAVLGGPPAALDAAGSPGDVTVFVDTVVPLLQERPSAYMRRFRYGTQPIEEPESRTDIVKLFELTAMGEAVPMFPTRDRALAEVEGQPIKR